MLHGKSKSFKSGDKKTINYLMTPVEVELIEFKKKKIILFDFTLLLLLKNEFIYFIRRHQ